MGTATLLAPLVGIGPGGMARFFMGRGPLGTSDVTGPGPLGMCPGPLGMDGAGLGPLGTGEAGPGPLGLDPGCP